MTTLNTKNIQANIHQGTNGGYALVADGYPIFAFGKNIGLAHSRFIKACHAYFGAVPNDAPIKKEVAEEASEEA